MIAATTIAGELIDTGEESDPILTHGAPDVHVSLAGEARCNGDEVDGAAATCTACGVALNDDGEAIDGPGHYGAGECPDNVLDVPAADGSDYGPHDPAAVPLTWANSAWIRTDADGDRITVAISVGDPRGAFTMSVERVQWTDDDGTARDELRLSVPTPDDSWPHAPLTPLASPGYFRIGGRA